ncbi:helix-turn-helix transcriptional regulator [Gordonia alkaliphila]|uniref:helix-turn-helix domain-containing protein n=1 Tax=Gordonia alkaliphila TaxID=1053547 RepID=UPI001FF2D029|nr:helix-turn-helix transcriptional regulator [Gordonia alkaliphila]MCK0441056.1 helix-turn-helix transcriptional regulator [Gordonia alkaliphila]
MSNLLELITAHPTVTATSLADFAKTIGVSRASVYRWESTMPAPATLRRIATTLDEPYAVVLAAALRSSGYTASDNDLLAGLTVHVLTHGFTWPAPVAAYADEAEAQRLVADADLAYNGEYRTNPILIAAAAPRPPHRYYARFDRGADKNVHDLSSRVRSHSAPVGPEAFPPLSDQDLAATGAISAPFIVAKNGYVLRIECEAFDEAIARTVVARTAELLADRIPPAGTDFLTVTDLPAIDRPLPTGIEATDDFRGLALSLDLDTVLSIEEIAQGARAYRAARAANAATARVISQFDAIAEAAEHTR